METYGETSTNSSPKSISKSMKLHINPIPKVHCNTQTVIGNERYCNFMSMNNFQISSIKSDQLELGLFRVREQFTEN